MSSGQPRILDLQCSSRLNSAINCIFLQHIQFIKGYVPFLLSLSPTVDIYQYIRTKNQAMLISDQFHKTERDKYLFVFKL